MSECRTSRTATRPDTGWAPGISRTRIGGAVLAAAVAIAGLAAAPAVAQDGMLRFFKSGPGAANDDQRQGSGIMVLELEGTLQREPFGFGTETGSPLLELVDRFETIAGMDRVDAVVLDVTRFMAGMTDLEELAPSIELLRDSGKKVVVYSYGFGTSEVILGGMADQAWVQTGSGVSVPGLYMEEMYLADMLEWVGLQAELIQVGDYKGANEAMTRSQPSEAWEQNISGLLDGMYGNMKRHIRDARGLSDRELELALEQGWSALADEAVKIGLIDGGVDEPALEARTAEWLGTDDYTIIDAPEAGGDAFGFGRSANPFAVFEELSKIFEGPAPLRASRPAIAVVHIDGAIVDGESSGPGMFGGEATSGSLTIRESLESIKEQDLVKGVVVRIDSPGGSAIASEVIWQGLRDLSEHKPVWISVGSMAASGGYYIAVGGDRIYVNPSSIVGSIGVVGGKISMGGLYDHLKIRTVSRSRGPHAAIFGSADPWTAEQRELVREEMVEIYELFTGRVGQGREGIDLSKTAEGRLFVGSDAIGLGMADEIGGLTDAMDDLAQQVGLGENYEVLEYPEAPGFEELLEEILGGFAQGRGIQGRGGLGVADQVLGGLRPLLGDDVVRQVRTHLSGLLELRDERVILMTPSALMFRD